MRLEHWFYTAPLRMRSLFRREQVEHDLIEKYSGQGLTPEEARLAALRAMDGLAQRKEEVPDPNNPENMIKVNPLHGPLGLTMTGKGNLVTANSDPAASMDPNHPSELIEFKTDGTFVSRLSIDPNNGGAFGVSIAPLGNAAMQLLFVNDNQVAMGKVTFSLMQ